MIVRIWQGKTRIEHLKTYENIILERDIPNYKKTPGFVKLTFLKRSDEKFTYFKLLTFWDNLAAVKNFAGKNFQQALAYKSDEQYLEDFPGNINHFEVFAE